MKSVAWVLVVLAHELVELLVFILADFALRLQPNRIHRVHDLIIELHGKTHKIRVALDDSLQGFRLSKLLELFFQVNDNTRSPLQVRALFNGVSGRTVTFPPQMFAIFPPGVSENLYFVRHHEGAVETNPELTDDIRLIAFLLERIQKLLRAGTRDGSDISHQLLTGHPNAVIGDSQSFGLLIGGDVDFQRQVAFENCVSL